MSGRLKGLVTVGLIVAALSGFAVGSLHKASSSAPSTATEQPGLVDIGYAQFMGIHHEQATLMSHIVLAHNDKRIFELASAIAINQLMEIGQLRGWLMLWHEPLLPTTERMDWLLLGKTAPDADLLKYIADCNASSGMAGMATTDELNELRSLDGDALIRLYLQLMIRHHQSGVSMAKFAAQNADSNVIRNTAAVTVMEQAQEISLMQARLHRDFAG